MLAEQVDKLNDYSDAELEKELDLLIADNNESEDDLKHVEEEMARLQLPEEPILIKKELSPTVPSI